MLVIQDLGKQQSQNCFSGFMSLAVVTSSWQTFNIRFKTKIFEIKIVLSVRSLFLFNASILDNITYVLKIREKKILKRQSNRVKRSSRKITSRSGDDSWRKGQNLSGGQRQRISIARTLIRIQKLLSSRSYHLLIIRLSN